MKYFIGLYILVLIFCENGFAEDAVPSSVYGLFVEKACSLEMDEKGEDVCSNFFFNTIKFFKKDSDSVYVDVKLHSPDGGGCEYYGMGIWEEGSIVSTGKSNVDGSSCKIKFSFAESDVSMTDYDGSCLSINYCSYDSSLITENVYTKSSRKKKTR